MLDAMVNNPRSGSRYTLRIGHAERDEAAAHLREHFVAGRLTFEEFIDRLDAALTAKTQDQISRLMADLPRIYRPTPRPAPRDEPGIIGRYAAVALLAVLVLLWMTAVTLLFRHGYTYPAGPSGIGH
jgi:hypothetical protein